jgi:hypothetical protein
MGKEKGKAMPLFNVVLHCVDVWGGHTLDEDVQLASGPCRFTLEKTAGLYPLYRKLGGP